MSRIEEEKEEKAEARFSFFLLLRLCVCVFFWFFDIIILKRAFFGEDKVGRTKEEGTQQQQ
jgi:hypothetical protein